MTCNSYQSLISSLICKGIIKNTSRHLHLYVPNPFWKCNRILETLFFPALIKIPSLPQSILWIYRKYGNVWCTHTMFLASSAFLKEMSPTCLYFCFVPWSSHSAREVDFLLAKLELKKEKNNHQQLKKKKKKDVHKGLWTMPQLPMGFQSRGPHQDRYSLLKQSPLQHASSQALNPPVPPRYSAKPQGQQVCIIA